MVACETCRRVAPSLHLCKGCRRVSYCNAACQKLDWKRHKQECCAQGLEEEKDEKKVKVPAFLAAPRPDAKSQHKWDVLFTKYVVKHVLESTRLQEIILASNGLEHNCCPLNALRELALLGGENAGEKGVFQLGSMGFAFPKQKGGVWFEYGPGPKPNVTLQDFMPKHEPSAEEKALGVYYRWKDGNKEAGILETVYPLLDVVIAQPVVKSMNAHAWVVMNKGGIVIDPWFHAYDDVVKGVETTRKRVYECVRGPVAVELFHRLIEGILWSVQLNED